VRILFVCHRIPYPPDKGEKIRAFHQLRAIAARHEVDLFTLADDPRDLAHKETLATFCRRVIVGRVSPTAARLHSLPYLLTRTPLTVPYFRSAFLHRAVREALAREKYDRLFVYCSAMAQYVDWEARTRVPVLLDIVDVDSNKWAQYAQTAAFPYSTVFRREARALRAYERRVCEASTCVLVSTEREAQMARQIAPAARVHVVPIGVDMALFDVPRRDVDQRSIVFTGDMSYFPNQDAAVFFAHEVLPLVHQHIPGVKFIVVGRNPGPRVRALRTLGDVLVTGSVPDVRPWLAGASVSVVPLRIAAGIQTKILEAMAAGLPVVATSRAVQGLTASVAEMVAVGNTPGEIAGGIVHLLNKPEAARQLGLEGRRRIATDYSWDIPLNRLLQLLEHPAAPPCSSDPLHESGLRLDPVPVA
jgi:polysaccharide biosynthesis protein PslH